MKSRARYPERGVIPLPYHTNMLSDSRRCQAFAGAIERIVRPGDVVLDLGSGTGILAYFAARQGARRVYAIETDPVVAQAAREYLRLNGVDEKVELVESRAEDFSLPEVAVDVVMCEMLHVGMVVEPQVAVLNSVRARLAQSQPGRPYRVIPEEVVHYCQLIHSDFNFHGYRAPMIRFGDTYAADPSLTVLSEITRYAVTDFGTMVQPEVNSFTSVVPTVTGTVNAIRLLSQAVLWLDPAQPAEDRLIDWFLNFLVIPLRDEIAVEAGNAVRVSLNYPYGGDLEQVEVSVAP